MNNSKTYLRKWELALLIALCFTLYLGLWADSGQKELSEKLIRLHIVAASDEVGDQAKKLLVRDEIIALLAPMISEAGGVSEARLVISQNLDELCEAARKISGQSAEATLAQENFPTRVYESFSLPAGEYSSLRITLGEGEGKNWWCVVFPPLCTELAVTEFTDAAGLDFDDVALMTEEGGYALKFRLVELWDSLRQVLSKN